MSPNSVNLLIILVVGAVLVVVANGNVVHINSLKLSPPSFHRVQEDREQEQHGLIKRSNIEVYHTAYGPSQASINLSQKANYWEELSKRMSNRAPKLL